MPFYNSIPIGSTKEVNDKNINKTSMRQKIPPKQAREHLTSSQKEIILVKCKFSANWTIDSTKFKSKLKNDFFMDPGIRGSQKFIWICKGPEYTRPYV